MVTVARQELMSNLSYVFNLAIKNNVPIYLKPAEYLDFEHPNFLLLQLYYLYCKFKNSKPIFTRRENMPQLVFKDEGRIIEEQTSGGLSSSQNPKSTPGANNSSESATTPQRSTHTAPGDSEKGLNSMGVIDEVDSVEFSSTMRSS